MCEVPKNPNLDAKSVSEMQKLEREMGVILLAWYQQPGELAKLSETQVEKLRKLEASLSATIVAYEPPKTDED